VKFVSDTDRFLALATPNEIEVFRGIFGPSPVQVCGVTAGLH
jgi:hypothetical protein